MPIGAVPGLGGLTALPSLPGVPAPSDAGGGFGQLVTDRLEALQGLHQTSDAFAVQAATGDLQDIHEYMIASTEAGIATELTVAVRNKAVEAMQTNMRYELTITALTNKFNGMRTAIGSR